jgi:hypothetical protein
MSFYGLMLAVTVLILTFYLIAFMNEIVLFSRIMNVYLRIAQILANPAFRGSLPS